MKGITMLGHITLLSTVSALLQTVLAYRDSSGYSRQFRDGDIIIGGAMEVHRYAGDRKCGELRDKGVQDVELINMLIEKINNDKTILKGIKLGTVLIDTCAWPSHGLENVFFGILPFVSKSTSELLNSCNSTTDKNKPRILAGILGPATSKVALQVANQLEIFQIPQVSHSATLQELSDKSVHSYFFRTVPPHYHLIQAILELAVEQKWNYISMIYGNDYYGLDAFQTLTQSIETLNICLAFGAAVPKNDYDDGEYDELARGILKGKANAVILYTNTIPASKLMSAVQKISNNNNSIIWIGGDGWTNYLPLNGDTSHLHGLEGSIGYSIFGEHLYAVDKYMSQLTLKERQGEYFDLNPWFSELIEIEKKCSLNKTSTRTRKCDLDETLNGNFMSYDGLLNLENAFMSYVHALDAYHRDVCQNKSGMCEALSKLSGTNILASELRHYLQDVSFVDSSGRNFHFDKNQDGPASYFINTFEKENIRDQNDLTQGWRRIGTYVFSNKSFHETLWIDVPKKANETMSVCSLPCELGEETIIDSQQDQMMGQVVKCEMDNCLKCCWKCRPCTSNQFVSPNTSSCESCPTMMTSNKARNGCEYIPTKEMNYKDTHSIVSLAIGCFGIVLTFIITGIYIQYRKCAIVRACGGELCFVVLFGVLMTFCNCFAFSAPTTFASCFAARFILSLGPTTMNSALLVKTLRVVIIFKYKTDLPDKLKAMLHTAPQICIILLFVFLDGILFLAWTVQAPPKPVWDYSSQDYLFLACPGISTNAIFTGLVFPFLVIVICTIFATINRKVPAGFNETLYIGMTMYTTCVIWLAFLPLFLVNEKNIPLKMATTSICLSCSALTVLLCVFVPRCYKILFHPEENTRKAIMSTSNAHELQNAKSSTLDSRLHSSDQRA